MAPAAGPLSGAAVPELDRLRALVAEQFPVYETRITPYSLILLVHADPATLEERFDRLRQQLWPLYYVPQIRLERGEYHIEVVRRPVQSAWGGYVNLSLLAATMLSTVFAGAFLWVSYRGGAALEGSDVLWGALYFAAPLMLILGLHELAHYALARRHHVDASLPFFLPVPPPILIFGTFGAFISLREPFPDKKALLDIGAAGPLAGFVAAIPLTLLGLHLSASSPVLSPAVCGPTFLGFSYGNLLIQTPTIWSLFALFVPGAEANLHPLALAGWVGILVTAFNLLPAGQLDGGHVARALLGKYSTYASWAVLGALIIIGFEFYFGWLIFAIFIFLVGIRHPPPLNDISPVGVPRALVGVLAVAVLVSGFTLVPLSAPSGEFALQNQSTAPLQPIPAGMAMADNLSFSVVNKDLVSHAYTLSGSVRAVPNIAGIGSPTPAEVAAFEANSTWVVHLPNGNVSWFNHTASFSIPRSDYSVIAADGSAGVTVSYENPQQGTVTVEITVLQLCPVPGVGNTSTYAANVY